MDGCRRRAVLWLLDWLPAFRAKMPATDNVPARRTCARVFDRILMPVKNSHRVSSLPSQLTYMRTSHGWF
jgi:hypothetical protein